MTSDTPPGSSHHPVKLIPSPQLLTWSAVLLSVVVCASISWLHLRQKQTLAREADLLENVRQARIDVAQGFMHLTLGGDPASPFDRATGQALMRQGIAAFERACAGLDLVSPSPLEPFQGSIIAFRDLLEAFSQDPGTGPAEEAALRIAFNDLETHAKRLDEAIRYRLTELSSHFDTGFLWVLSGSVLLLAGICAAMFVTMRAKESSDRALREHTLRLQLAVEAGRVGLWDWDLRTNQVFFSNEWKRQIGYGDHGIPNEFDEWERRVHPDDIERWRKTIREFVEGLSPGLKLEFRFQHKDGSYRWIYAQASPVRDQAGRLIRMVGSHVDVTELRRAEETLRRQEMLLREAGEIAQVGGWEFDPVTLKGNWTDETARLHEIDASREPTATLGLSFYQGESRERIEAAVKDAIELGQPYDLELELTTAKGNHRWVRTICHPILENGKAVRIRGSIQDITERKQAEMERERLVSAIEQAGEDVVITDAQGTILYVNPAFERVTGYSRQEAVGRNPRILKSGAHDASYYQELWSTIRRGDIWKGRIVNKRRDGSLITEDASISPIRDTTGAIVSYVSVKRDITDQLRLREEKDQLQDQLLQARKMEAVGRLAGGVAHDFNNMLQTILGYADLALRETEGTGFLYESIQEIKKAGQRSADLTRQLLAFARRQTVSPRVLDLNDTVSGMLKLLQRLIGEDIDLAWMPGRGLWEIKIDPSQVDQILANLAVNARDAIRGVGKVTLETANFTLDAAYCMEHAESAPGDYVCLSVSDDGRGMDRATIEHIFEPFFTTKGVGEGTGLGLATVYGIVRQNDGFISVYSEPGEGTTFRVYLPRFAAEIPTPSDGIVVEPSRGGTETILFVEDEETVLLLGKRFLKELGYSVLTALTPHEAIEVAQQYQDSIHLLVTDVVMPEMNGKELSSRLTSARPGIKTIFISGYTANVIAHRGVLDEGLLFVQKPFSAQSLGNAVRQALDG